MTWMASFKSDAEDGPLGTPPSSASVEAINTDDCPNFFSNFIWGIKDDFSLSIPAKTAPKKHK